jgi:hypothetical protein
MTSYLTPITPRVSTRDLALLQKITTLGTEL